MHLVWFAFSLPLGSGIRSAAESRPLSLWGHWYKWLCVVMTASLRHSVPASASSWSWFSGSWPRSKRCCSTAPARFDTFTGLGERLPLESLNSAAVVIKNSESCRQTDLPIKVGLKVTSRKMVIPALLKVPGMSLRSRPDELRPVGGVALCFVPWPLSFSLVYFFCLPCPLPLPFCLPLVPFRPLVWRGHNDFWSLMASSG